MDTLTPQQRSERMSRVRGSNTKPEIFVRRVLRALGYGYRLTAPQLPGRPDIIFSSRKALIFVHGCFWHRHDDPACRLARIPKSKKDFWIAKLDGNRARDIRLRTELGQLGWRVLTLWECELKNEAALRGKLVRFLGPSTRLSSSREPVD